MVKRVSDLTREDIKRLHDLVNPSGEDTGKRYGGVSRAAEHFGVSRGTIHNWLKAYPKRPLDAEDYSAALNELSSALDQIKHTVKDVKRHFENSVVIDLLELRMNREMLGESIEQQRQRIIETVANGGKDKSHVEERLEELDINVYKSIMVLREYRRKANL